jgi:hypothetical protein
LNGRAADLQFCDARLASAAPRDSQVAVAKQRAVVVKVVVASTHSLNFFTRSSRRRSSTVRMTLAREESSYVGDRSAARFARRPVSLHRGPSQGRSSSLRCGRSTWTRPTATGAWLRAKRPTDRGWPPNRMLCEDSTGVARGCSLPPFQGWPGVARSADRRRGAHAACARGRASAPLGLSVTAPGRLQSRTAPLQRSGRSALACS